MTEPTYPECDQCSYARWEILGLNRDLQRQNTDLKAKLAKTRPKSLKPAVVYAFNRVDEALACYQESIKTHDNDYAYELLLETFNAMRELRMEVEK